MDEMGQWGQFLASIHLSEQCQEVCLLQRLRKVSIHAGVETLLGVTFDGKSGKSNDGEPAAGFRFLRSPFAGGIEAIHFGHMDIHQNDIELTAGEGVEGEQAIADALHFMAAL